MLTIHLRQLFVIAATAVDWDFPMLFQGYGADVAFKGEYFWWTWGVRYNAMSWYDDGSFGCRMFLTLERLWLVSTDEYSVLCG